MMSQGSLSVAEEVAPTFVDSFGKTVKFWKCPRCGRWLKPRYAQTYYHLPPHKCKGEVLGENQMFAKLEEEQKPTLEVKSN
jgi:hypothetical protein